MDGLSAAASIIALIQITEELISVGKSIKNAPQEILDVTKDLDNFSRTLEIIRRGAQEEEQRNPERAKATLELLLRRSKNEKGVVEEAGVIPRMSQIISDAGNKLYPQADWRRSKFVQRATWHFNKDSISDMRKAIAECLNIVNFNLSTRILKLTETNNELVVTSNELALANNELAVTSNKLAVVNNENTEDIKGMVGDVQGQLKKVLLEQEARHEEEERREKEEVMEWLSPFSFKAKDRQLWHDCCQNTGSWLWKDQRFDAWVKGSQTPWYIRAYGAPGVGKTVLSSIISHHLIQSSAFEPLILCVYFDYKLGKTQNVSNLVGGLLKQLIQKDPSAPLPEGLQELYRKARFVKDRSSSYYEKIYEMLKGELSVREDPLYLIVDGFDELPLGDRKPFRDMLKKLLRLQDKMVILTRKVSKETAAGTYKCDICKKDGFQLAFRCRICNRGNFDLCYDCKAKGFTCLNATHRLTEPYEQIEIEVDIPSEDIATYVRWVIEQSIGDKTRFQADDRFASDDDDPDMTYFQNFCRKSAENRTQIVAGVTEKANGRFLFAKLQMDSLQAQQNKRKLLNALHKFPKEIDEIYDEALQRVASPKNAFRQRALRILGLVGLARRPLRRRELQQALLVLDLDEDEDVLDLGDDEVEDVNSILSTTSGLVIFEDDQFRLVHRSLEEYILNNQNQKKYLPTAEFDVAQACLKYLEAVLPEKSVTDEELQKLSNERPLLPYASQFWGDHVRRAQVSQGDLEELTDSIVRLIDHSARRNMCIRTAWITDLGGEDTWDTGSSVNSLHVCAWYGLPAVLATLSPEPGSVDIVERKHGQTPLMYACRRGHVEVTSQLLDLGASIEQVSALGRTALFEAILGQDNVRNYHEANNDSDHIKVIGLLVKRMTAASINDTLHAQEYSRTALMLAARRGLLSTTEVLLQCQGIDVDLQDATGLTALHLAARDDHVPVVRRLIESEASVNTVDFHAGRSPLRSAAEKNLVGVVNELLKNNADTDQQDFQGGTALLRAINKGAEDVVELMLTHSINLTGVDEDGQSLLHGAARYGRCAIIRLLLDHTPESPQKADPNVRDKIGMTPLHYASKEGQSLAVSLLIEYRADLSLRDNFNRTPLEVAWQYGQGEVMSVLKEADIQGSQIPFDVAQLPVWAMAKHELVELVELAISTRPDDLLVREPGTDFTALHWSVGHSDRNGIIDILLEAQKIPINSVNRQKRTALHKAAYEGDSYALDTLIQHKPEIDLDAADRWGDTPLFLAQSEGRFDIALQLIEAGCTVDKTKIDVPQLFFHAVEEGNVEWARTLIDDHGIDRSMQNKRGLRALKIAEAAEDTDMMAMLQQAPTVDFAALAITSGAQSRKGDLKDEEGYDALKDIKFTPFRSRPLDLSEPDTPVSENPVPLLSA